MGLRIRTNIQALIAQRHLESSTEKVGKHSERLASGYRINKAADDAAGLAISEVLRADIRSLDQARRNANDAVSLIQVAEGGLEEINNVMIRLRELSIQAASDTIGPREREYLDKEYRQLKDEIDRIALSTEFNGTRMLIGNKELDESLLGERNIPPFEIQVGKDYFPIADSIETPNPVNIIRIDMRDLNATTEGEGSLELGSSQNDEATAVNTKEKAQQSIDVVDSAMTKVAKYRAHLGAIQNRLESTNRNLMIAVENLGAARSRIKDADFATESAEFTQATILQQAGSAVLSQANQMPKVALQLLQ